MATYEITDMPNSASDRLGLDSRVDAEAHRVAGRFVVFVDGSGETVLQISAAHVLQIKTLAGCATHDGPGACLVGITGPVVRKHVSASRRSRSSSLARGSTLTRG